MPQFSQLLNVINRFGSVYLNFRSVLGIINMIVLFHEDVTPCPHKIPMNVVYKQFILTSIFM